MNTAATRIHPTPTTITVIALLVIAGVSLFIRIALPYDQVFVDGSVWFRGIDPWYHMRLVDNILYHFPHRIAFDPYTYYPHGAVPFFRPLFDWLTASAAWLAGLGSPSQHTVDVVAAYLPPVLGTLIIIPTYFIGRELFNRWVGLLSAALLAILPGEFLGRSLLGFTDHHVAESLFSTVAMLFLILAIKASREREISFEHLGRGSWATVKKPVSYAVLAGVFLGVYLLAWVGGLLLIFIIFSYFLLQFIIEHMRGKSTDYLCMVSVLVLLIGTVMVLPITGGGKLGTIYRVSLAIAVLAPLALNRLSRFLAGKAVKPVYYPLVLIGLAAISLVVLYVARPSLASSMLELFRIFSPSGASLTILEMHPLFLPYGQFSLNTAWLSFTTSFFISLIALGLLIYVAIRSKGADTTLFLVWSVIMLLAVLGQRRFGYYYAINAALLTGYLCYRMLDLAGLKKLLIPVEGTVKIVRKTKAKAKSQLRARGKALQQHRAIRMRVVAAGIAIFALAFLPNIAKAKALASEPSLMTDAWYSSLLWLEENSPEPFDDPNSYYQLYKAPAWGEDYSYPESAYGVMSWWDYGHWITRIAHRIPVANPFQQGASTAARFFISQNEESVDQMMDSLDMKYVILDYALSTAKFGALPAWADSDRNDFYGIYYRLLPGGKLGPTVLYYPSYYRSAVVRLYNFHGKAAVPEKSKVISYEEKKSKEGVWYKEITSTKTFHSYEEAADYLTEHKSENYRMVSSDQFSTPVPLEGLQHYKLVYESDATVRLSGETLPEVLIFEYVSHSNS